MTRTVFDDRIEQATATDDVWDVAETIAREMGEEHAGRLEACAMCTEYTPLAVNRAIDLPKHRKFRMLVDSVADTLVSARSGWVYSHLADEYESSYYAALPDPEGCLTCKEARAGAIGECGHERHGETCPLVEAERV